MGARSQLGKDSPFGLLGSCPVDAKWTIPVRTSRGPRARGALAVAKTATELQLTRGVGPFAGGRVDGRPVHRLSPGEGEDLSMGSTSDNVNRRDLIKRSAALGLIAVPAMGLLCACASGGSDSDNKVDKGKKTPRNPLGGQRGRASWRSSSSTVASATSTPWTPRRCTRRPSRRPTVKHSNDPEDPYQAAAALQRRQPAGPHRQLRRRADGHRRAWSARSSSPTSAAAGRALPRRPDKKVRDTLLPGIVEMGQFGGDKV